MEQTIIPIIPTAPANPASAQVDGVQGNADASPPQSQAMTTVQTEASPAETAPQSPSRNPEAVRPRPRHQISTVNSTSQGIRTENNVYTDDLSPSEIEALFAAQAHKGAPGVGGTHVMTGTDMDLLLNSLGNSGSANPTGYDSYTWLPSWASTSHKGGSGANANVNTGASAKPRTASRTDRRATYDTGDVYAENVYEDDEYQDTYPGDDPAEDTRRIVLETAATLATVDDTTVDTRDMIRELVEDVKSLQTQTNDMEDSLGVVKAQNAAMTEEIKELRFTIVTMRTHVATLIRLLTTMAPQSAPPAPTTATSAVASASTGTGPGTGTGTPSTPDTPVSAVASTGTGTGTPPGNSGNGGKKDTAPVDGPH